MPVAAGQIAPDFSLPTDEGESLTLSSLRGKWVILYAYPRDSTSGCTTQACDFRDSFPIFQSSNAAVLGISPDSVESHRKFRAEHDLPFTLLSDADKEVLLTYDVWKQKKMYGRQYMGVVRTTFLIDPGGMIVRVFENVKPAGHAGEVLAAIAELDTAGA